MMQRARDLRDWLHARNMNRRTAGQVRPQMYACPHPTPPGFTTCMFGSLYCRSCWTQFRC